MPPPYERMVEEARLTRARLLSILEDLRREYQLSMQLRMEAAALRERASSASLPKPSHQPDELPAHLPAGSDAPALRLVERLAGVGWIECAGIRAGETAYEIDVWDIELSRESHVVSGTHVAVHLRRPTFSGTSWSGQFLTLHLGDGRAVSGFLSDDGTSLVRTSALA